MSKKQHLDEHRRYWTDAPPLSISIQCTPAFQKRLAWILENSEGTVLDCGCNDGTFTIELYKKGHKVVGVDILPEMVLRALDAVDEQELDDERITFHVMDIEDLDFEDESFDTVILTEILEHLINPRTGLREVNRVLNSKGKLLCIVPNGLDRQPTHYNTFDFVRLQESLRDYFTIESLESDFTSFFCVARKTEGAVGRVLELRSEGHQAVPGVSEQKR